MDCKIIPTAVATLSNISQSFFKLMIDDKKTLRKIMKNKREAMSAQEISKARNDLIKNFETLKLKQDPKKLVISGYYPIKNEVDCLVLLKKFSQKGSTVALPFIVGQQMVMKKYQGKPDELLPDQYGILAPKLSSTTIVPNIILAPLLAADFAGNRLGYGRAYYDKYVAQYKDRNILYIGLAYKWQILRQIAIQKHDQKLDAILTPNDFLIIKLAKCKKYFNIKKI